MAFTPNPNLETLTEEQARLAAAPENSPLHELSQLPIRSRVITTGLLIKLPATHTPEGETVIVTPMMFHPYSQSEEGKRRRFNGSWDCRVVGGNSKTYAPGGWDLSIPEAALVRGEVVTL